MSSPGFDYSGLGSAISGISGGVGGLLSAGAYDQAGDLADKNAGIAKLSTGIQLEQATRKGYQILGATEAAAGANNLSLSGSAMDILRSNREQTFLDHSLTALQGEIDVNSWKEKAASDHGAAQAAQAGGIGSILGGVVSIAGLFSDERLKDILGPDGIHLPGINFYRFRFKGTSRVLRGVMAQEVQKVRPEAVMQHPSGYLMVNYGMLGLAGMSDA